MAKRKANRGAVRYITAAPSRVKTVYRNAKKKRAGRTKRVMHLGVDAGIAGVAYNLLTKRTPNWDSPLTVLQYKDQTVGFKLEHMITPIKTTIMDLDTWKPLIVGGIASASTKIPVVKKFAQPLDSAIKAHTKGRWGL